MKDLTRLIWLATGILLGALGAWLLFAPPRPAHAAGNDRFEDFILCTGPVAINANTPTDGVWLLDYRTGKLLATLIDRAFGKIGGWAEVDLAAEFGLKAKQDVHFMMTTGSITNGQAALYIAETTSGRFGIYTMGPRPDGRPGIAVRRHDLTVFRQAAPQ
jgi:hypothetical protein